jgi:two-component system NtrC family sensor kinase
LRQITLRIGTCLDLNTVLQETADGMVYLLGYDTALVFLLDEEGREGSPLKARAICSRRQILPRIEALPGRSLTSLELPASHGLGGPASNALDHRAAVSHNLRDLVAADLKGALRSALGDLLGCGTLLYVPLATQEGPVGSILASTPREHLTEQDHSAAAILAGQAARAIANAQLFQRVESAKQQWEASVDACQDQVMVLTSEHEIIRANTAVAEAAVLAIQQIPGRRCYQVLHGLDQPIEGCPMRECLSSGRPAFAQTEDASGRSWHRWLYPLTASGGEVQTVVEYSRDVTGSREAQRRLLQAEKLATLGEIIAEVAHEISTPLTVILGYSQLLQDGALSGETAQDLQVIEQAARRCRRIVENLLAFSRKRERQRTCADLNQVLREAVGLRAYELHVRNIEVTLDLHPDLPPTLADPHQLQQVFLNLINNAEQAMTKAHGRGTLHLRSRVLPGPGCDSSPSPLGGEASSPQALSTIRMEFTDDGPGIPPEALDRIFDPFFSTKPEGQGTGLGLSICYGIVKEHGGHIWAESPPNQGATLILELPVIAPGEEGERPEAEDPTSAERDPLSARVLVVDDERWVAGLLQSAMGGYGLSVDAAYDGQEALDRIRREDYDLILCDIKMPGLTGRELFAHLQEASPGCAEQFIFMSGDMATEDTRAFLAETGRPWLSKPFTLDQVEEAMRLALQGAPPA